MKMLIITAIESYEKEVVNILKSSNINAFSSTNVLGHVNNNDPHLEDNWFGSDTQDYRSMLFFSLVAESSVEQVYEKIEQFNDQLKSRSKIHISILNVEKSN